MCYKRRDTIIGVFGYGPVAGSFARSADVSISGIMIYCRARLRGTTDLNPTRLEICVQSSFTSFRAVCHSCILTRNVAIFVQYHVYFIISCLFNVLSLMSFKCDILFNFLHCKENPIYVFLFQELLGLSPNFHIHVSVSDLYIPRIGPHISCSRIGRRILEIYKSLTDI